MPIIPKSKKQVSYKAGEYVAAINYSIGTLPSTVDLSSSDYLIGTLVPPEGGIIYAAWGDTIDINTAPMKMEDKYHVNFGTNDPLPDNNLTFQGSITGGEFNYQTASKVIII